VREREKNIKKKPFFPKILKSPREILISKFFQIPFPMEWEAGKG
jgi:hypothetical protein